MRKRILVIDDDSDALEVIEAALKYVGYKAFKLSYVNDIFKAVNQYRPDVLIIDFVLGGTTGAEICRQLKDDTVTKHLPVVLISAYPQSGEVLSNSSCDCFIQKPFSLEDLYAGIDNCLKLNDNSGDE